MHGVSICLNVPQPWGLEVWGCARMQIWGVWAVTTPLLHLTGEWNIFKRVSRMRGNNLAADINPMSAWLPGESI